MPIGALDALVPTVGGGEAPSLSSTKLLRHCHYCQYVVMIPEFHSEFVIVGMHVDGILEGEGTYCREVRRIVAVYNLIPDCM